MDGRVYIKRAMREGTKYDTVMLDAFDHEYIPEHLLTREFLTEAKSLLTPQGVLIGNTFSSSKLYDHESTTYAAVFGSFFNLKRENRVIVARPAGLPSADAIRAKVAGIRAGAAQLWCGRAVDAGAVLHPPGLGHLSARAD